MPDTQEQQVYKIKLGGQLYQFRDKPGLSQDDAVKSAVTRYPKFAAAYKQHTQTKLNSNPLMGPQGPTSMGAPKPWEPHASGMTEEAKKEHPIKAAIEKGVGRVEEFGELAGKTALALVPPTAGGMAVNKLASMARAGKTIGEVEQAASKIPVSMHEVTDVVDRAMELDSHGHSAPKVIKDLVSTFSTASKRTGAIAGPGGKLQPLLSFKEARDFYQAASKLTEDEASKATGAMKYQVMQLASKLGERITEAAEQAGVGEKYSKAMKEYRQMAQLGRTVDKAIKVAITGAGLAAAYKIFNEAYKLVEK